MKRYQRTARQVILPPTPPTVPAQFMDERGAAAHLGLAPITLRSWRRCGKGPRFAKFGKAVRYDVRDLDAFGESMKVA